MAQLLCKNTDYNTRVETHSHKGIVWDIWLYNITKFGTQSQLDSDYLIREHAACVISW